ncbi:MAG: hypothetical protein ACRDI2_03060, partial [Chloroflexota bacterium]
MSAATSPAGGRPPAAIAAPSRAATPMAGASAPPAATGEAPDLAGFRGALLRLDVRLRLAVEALRGEVAERARDPFRGLYISEAHVDRLLAAAPPAEVGERLLAGSAANVAPRLDRLARSAGLSPFEQETLLICLAPDLDLRYERLYGYLQDDVTRRRPTVDLILRLLCPALEDRVTARAALGPSGPLLRDGLLTLSDEAAANWPLLARPLRVDERIADFLLNSDRPDPRIESVCELYPAPPEGQEADVVALPSDVRDGLIRLLRGATNRGGEAAKGRGAGPAGRGPILYLHGGPGTSKLATARAVCGLAGRRLLVLDLAALLTGGKPPATILPLVIREARLQDGALCIDGFDRLLADEPETVATRAHLRRLLASSPAAPLPVLLLGEARWEPATWLPEATTIRVELPAPGPGVRLQVWRSLLDGQAPAEDVAALATQFRMDGEA